MAWKRLTAFAASIVMAGSLTGCAGRETAKALCDAIMAGDRNGIESLMDAMDDFDRPNVVLPALVEALEGDVSTPLLTALRIGDAETALALLEAGASATYAPGKLASPHSRRTVGTEEATLRRSPHCSNVGPTRTNGGTSRRSTD